MIRLLLVDDQASVREGLRMLLALEPDIVVVGEAQGGQVAVEQARRLQPDVVLLDMVMPEMDGIATATALREVAPACAVVVLSLYDDATNRERARAAGAVAFLCKHSAAETLLSAIREAALEGRSRPR